MPEPRCFYCDNLVPATDAKLTATGKIYGPCCADLGDKASPDASGDHSRALSG